MAIASVGTLGTGVSSTSSSSFTLTTATNSLAAGDFGILTVVTDNTATADGETSTHTSVSGGTGNWTKLGEYTNTVGGAAADGVCTSVWLFEATGSVAVGTVITMNLSAARVDKVASFWKYTKAAGTTIQKTTGTTNPIVNGTDGANGFGSVSFSGLASASRLYFRGLGKEANTTTGITVSTNFTAITGNRSRNNASAVTLRGEFRINTSTGETSNPTLAVAGDTAGVFLALQEVTAPVTGTLSATLAELTLSGTGDVDVAGSLSSTLGDLTLSSDTDVLAQGTLSATLDALTLSASAAIVDGVSATLSATLGELTLVGAGDVDVAGSLSVTLDALTVSSQAYVSRQATLAATLDTLTLAGQGDVDVAGALAATLDSLTLASAGDVDVAGSLAATLAPLTAAGAGSVLVVGTLSTTLADLTLESLAYLPPPPIEATLAATLGDSTLASSATISSPIEATLDATLGALTLSARIGEEQQQARAGGGGWVRREDVKRMEDWVTTKETRRARARIQLEGLSASGIIEVVAAPAQVRAALALGDLVATSYATVDWSGVIAQDDEELMLWA